MKMIFFTLGILLALNSYAQQNSLELFEEQQKKEKLEKQFERDKDAFSAKKQKDLAYQIINKGLLTQCAGSKDDLNKYNSHAGAAYYRGNRYYYKFYNSPSREDCDSRSCKLNANGGSYNFFDLENITPYTLRNNGNQLNAPGIGDDESELYINESVQLWIKNKNTSKPEISKSVCEIKNKGLAEYK